MSLKIQFIGAVKTVTGSKYKLTYNGQEILVDCGLFQGPKELRDRNWQQPPFDPNSIKALLLTHAHIDHTGYIPRLARLGFNKKIYCTEGTYDLCKILLPDSARLQEEDAAYANKKKFSKHKPALPLYTEKDAEAALALFHPIEFEQEFTLENGLRARFLPVGHIIGASFIEIFDGKKYIVFSGDVGRFNDPIMLPPRWLKRADYLVLESTYGSREHPVLDTMDELETVVNRTIRRGGVVLIPAFAVARAQIILYFIYLLKRSKRIPNVPVYLNSPMAIATTEILCKHTYYHRLSESQCADLSNTATYVQTVEDSKKLNQLKGPMIIISASGMLTGGRILHHVKKFGPDPKNTIVLTGYQAQGTQGRSLQEGARSLKIHGEEVAINAEVTELTSLSAHADRKEILSWLSHLNKPPKKIFLTHGEEEGSEALKKAIESTLGFKVHLPDYLEEVNLD